MTPRSAPPAAPLLRVDGLVKHYRLPRERLLRPAPVVEALRGVGFSLQAGRSLGIVGESGSGKSTLARLVMALETPTAGSVHLLGRDLNALPPDELTLARRDFQMVFQDPYGSLDPRQRIGRVVAEPLGKAEAGTAQERVAEALEAVGLRASDERRYAHEFSGGQRQRIAIARALITRPRLIVADEPVSALDVSVQAQVLNLLADLQQQFGVTYLLVSHDLAVVDHVCDDVAVMYAGRIVEQGPPEQLFRAAAHPYTRALLEAMPLATATATARPVAGAGEKRSPRWHPGMKSASLPVDADARVDPPAMAETPTDTACAFAPRCRFRQSRCRSERPPLRSVGDARLAACHFAEALLTAHPFPGDDR